MYIENCNFYFDKNDYLSYDNVKFIVNFKQNDYNFIGRRSRVYAIEPRIYYDYGKSTYMMHINFVDAYKPNNNLFMKLLVTKDKQKNKMSMLYNLRKTLRLIYDIVYLRVRHMGAIEFESEPLLSIMFDNLWYTEKYNLVAYCHGYTNVYLNVDNPTVRHNTILAAQRVNTGATNNKIIVKDNILYTPSNIIMYPDSYNYDINKEISCKLNFVIPREEAYIKKKWYEYRIGSCTPLPLLVKFINNIEIFNDIGEIYINDEYELLKYI